MCMYCKNLHKKILCLVLVVIMSFALGGCGNAGGTNHSRIANDAQQEGGNSSVSKDATQTEGDETETDSEDEEISADDICYTVGLDLIDKIQEQVELRDLQIQGGKSLPEDYSLVEEANPLKSPDRVYRLDIDFDDTSLIQEIKDEDIYGFISSEENQDILNFVAVDTIWNNMPFYACVDGEGTFSDERNMEMKYFKVYECFISNKITERTSLVFCKEGYDPVWVVFRPQENSIVEAYAVVFTGEIADEITINPEEVVNNLGGWFEGWGLPEPVGKVTELDSVQRCNILQDGDFKQIELNDLASDCTEIMFDKGINITASLYTRMSTNSVSIIEEYLSLSPNIQNIYWIKQSEMEEECNNYFSSFGLEYDSLTEDKQSKLYAKLMDKIPFAVAQEERQQNNVDYTALLDEMSNYTMYFEGMTTENGEIVEDPICCIVDLGENISPLFMVIYPDADTGVITVKGWVIWGENADALYRNILQLQEWFELYDISNWLVNYFGYYLY